MVTCRITVRRIVSFCIIFSLIFLLLCVPKPVIADTNVLYYINGANVNVRAGASTKYNSIDKISYAYVDLVDTVEGQNATGWGTTWYKIRYDDIEGYVYGEWFEIIQVPDTEPDADFETRLLSFPESYRDSLRELKAQYPNWSFKADNLSISFADAVAGEDAFPTKLVPSNYGSSWKSMGKDAYNWNSGTWNKNAGNWHAASTEVIAYYMDPRNFLNANDIYMFAQQSYDPATQSEKGLEAVVAGTFLADGYTDENDTEYGGSYIKVIMEAAKQSGMSPYVIASTIILEQGSAGNSPLISGIYEGCSGYYNFFNYKAAGDTYTDVVVNGLEYAKLQGWTTRSKSIIDGSKFSANGYIAAGQDTYYYMDFNVKVTPYFTHQYAQNVTDALGKGANMRKYYSANPNAPLNFIIPVYKDMPEISAKLVAESNELNNYYFTSLSVSGFSMYTENYNLSISGNIRLTYTVPDGASYAGDAVFSLKKGSNTVTLPVKSQTGYINNYTLTVTASADCYLVIGDTPFPGEQPETIIKRGDINGDGVLDVLDSTALKLHFLSIAELSGDSFIRADINQDDQVDVLDSTALKLHFLDIVRLFD